MSSPISRTDSPSQDEHAKRKWDEREAPEKHTEGTSTSGTGNEAEAEAVPPKKIKPEAGAASVSKAEVKQIRQNLKTMPLEDNGVAQAVDSQNRDMEDAESQGSIDEAAQDKQMEDTTQQSAVKSDTPEDTESTPSSVGDPDQESASATDSPVMASSTHENNGSSTTSAVSPSETKSKQGGFSNTSSISPFGTVKAGESIFGSSSSTLKGLAATSDSSPFAAVEKTNVFDSKPSAFSGGFGNTSSVSPFASMASSSNIFGSSSSKSAFAADEPTKSVFGTQESAKSVFGTQAPAKSAFAAEEPVKSAFSKEETVKSAGEASGASSGFGNTAESTAGTVFGARSVLGSVGGSSPLPSQASPFQPPRLQSTSGSFGTFGSKQSFLSKEGSFASGSFIDQEKASQGQEDFGSLLSQDVGENDGENDPSEETEHNFGAGVFSGADQIDVQTGEEEEMNIYQTKGKLFTDTEKTHSWKERGKGTFKVNVGRRDTKVARLVMRTDGVLRLILNVAIFPDMNVVITGEKYVRFIGIEEGKPIPFLLKVKDATVAEDIVRSINRAVERQANGRGQGVALRD
ncbi:hypothetical protein BGZ75_002746 [Mortierella antarctica]|nr:hypothetical protein BGZ75_002746 [Mortierella antarctica]